MSSLSVLAAAVIALAQGYSPAPRNIAPIDMKSSCTEEAAVDVNRGAAFLLALAPADARRAFNRASERDPDCALAGWGRAMSWLPADPWRTSQQALREGRDAIRRVAGRGTPREQAYVKTAAALFEDPRTVPDPGPPDPGAAPMPIGTRLERYRDATRILAAELADDQVATILFARATLLLSTVPADDSAREAAAIIERRFGVDFPPVVQGVSQNDSLHLAAALTLLLARDGPTLADTPQGAARAVARIATLPLARYLPARTYVRLGDWANAAASAEAAIALAGSPASPELVHGVDRRDVAAEWLVEAYVQQGRFAKADALIAETRRALDAGVGADDPAAREAIFDALVRMRVRYVLARADWTSGLEANARAQGCDAPSTPSTAASCAFLHAYSAARLAWPGAKPDRLQEAARINERLGGVNGGQTSIVELLRVTVRAAIAAGQEEHPELELLLMHTSDLEERLLRSGQLVLPFAPAQEIAGDLFYQANRFEQARTRYANALVARPYRGRSMLGFARAWTRVENRKAAVDAYKQFLFVWKDADPDAPELAEARAFIGEP